MVDNQVVYAPTVLFGKFVPTQLFTEPRHQILVNCVGAASRRQKGQLRDSLPKQVARFHLLAGIVTTFANQARTCNVFSSMWRRRAQRKCTLCQTPCEPGGSSPCPLCLLFWHDECSQRLWQANDQNKWRDPLTLFATLGGGGNASTAFGKLPSWFRGILLAGAVGAPTSSAATSASASSSSCSQVRRRTGRDSWSSRAKPSTQHRLYRDTWQPARVVRDMMFHAILNARCQDLRLLPDYLLSLDNAVRPPRF